MIVVPGATSVVDTKGEYTPNLDEKIRLTGAVADYEAKLAPKIVLLAGKPSNIDSAKHLAAEVTFLQKESVRRTGAEIPQNIIFSEHVSTDTIGNMKQLEIIMGDRLNVAAIETTDYHVARATTDACREGIDAFARPAESTLAGDGEARKLIHSFQKKLSFGRKLREKGALVVTLFTP